MAHQSLASPLQMMNTFFYFTQPYGKPKRICKFATSGPTTLCAALPAM